MSWCGLVGSSAVLWFVFVEGSWSGVGSLYLISTLWPGS